MVPGLRAILAVPLALLLQAQRPPGVPADAQLVGPPLSYGTILYGEPEVIDMIRPATAPGRLDSVVAEQRVEIPSRHMILARRVVTGRPFRVDLPAGSYFRFYRGPDGQRQCFARMPMVPYEPPEDENGEIFPGTCLVDADADGAYEQLRMLPYLSRNQPRDVAIAPVRLLRAPTADDPRAPRSRVYRRIRIAETSDADIVLVLEHGAANPGQGTPEYRDRGLADRTSLPLRPGATVSIAGLSLRVEGGPGAWRVESRGAFDPWVSLEQDGTAVRAGPFYIPPRED